MSRAAAALLAACLLAAGAARAAPNILLIKIEDTNDWVQGFDGHPDAQTPSLVELASRGVRFTNAQAPSPLCNPSKTATLLGLAPRRTGVLTNQQTPFRNFTPPHARSLFEFFLAKGYYVAGNGLIFHQDYDSVVEPWSEFPSYNWGRGQFGVTPKNGLPELQAVSPGFDWGVTGGSVSQYWGDYGIATYGSTFLGRTHDRPFLLALGFTMPHVQWYVPQAYWDQAPAAPALPHVVPDDRDDMPPYPQLHIDREQHRIITEAGKWQDAMRGYLAALRLVDDQIGRVLAALDASAYAGNTIIVFYSDHGFHMGEKEAWGKGTLWEESTRVPFIIVAPGVAPAGTATAHAVSLLDIYPTLIQLAGFTPDQELDGASLAGLLADPVAGTRTTDYALTSYYYGDSLRDSRWRYTRYRPANPALGGEELYDHDVDPDENVNLAGSPDHAAVKAAMAAKLAQALAHGPSLRPWLAIDAPVDGAQLTGAAVALSATATDPEDGDLAAAVQWESNLDGPISSPANLSPGSHVLTATVTDSTQQVATRQVVVHVRSAHDDEATTPAGTPVEIAVLANDVGFADPVDVQLVAAPAEGAVTVVGSPGNQSELRVRFAPADGFTGVATFGYSVADGIRTDAAAVAVTVQPVQVPELTIAAPTDGLQTTGDDVVLAATATDAEDGDLSASVQWSSDPDGPLSSPATLSAGHHVLTASVTDSAGHAVSGQRAVHVREARDDQVTSEALDAVVIDALANDVGFADPVEVQIVDAPAAGAVTVVGSPGSRSDVRLQFAPPPGFAGSASFTYSVSDGTSVDTAFVTVQIQADRDEDGVDDSVDNCLGLANPDQRDTSGDGYGNACDGDFNGDGGVNAADLAIFRLRFASPDPDADIDGNGTVNATDLARFRLLFGKPPGPSALAP